MPDIYPDYPALPAEWLVRPEDQPDYLELPGVILDESVSLGAALSDAQVARGLGEQVAIIHHETGVQLTFGDISRRSDALAEGLLTLGVAPGDRVGIRSPNCPEGIVAAVAVWKTGAVVVPIPFIARSSELDFYFTDTRPKVLIADGRAEDVPMVIDRARAGDVAHVITFGVEKAPEGATTWQDAVANSTPRQQANVQLDGVAVVWHTGGTTGTPKGCYHTQRRFLLAGLSYGMATQAGPGQRWAAAAPIGHALGLIHHTIFTLLHGATIVLIERYPDPANLLAAINQHAVTTFTAITSSWARMADVLDRGECSAPTTLRTGFAMWQSSSSSDVADSWRAHGVTLLNNFGSTAFATWVLIPRMGETVPQGALGSPAPGYEVCVVEASTGERVPDGEIGQMSVRGVSGLTYWRLPDKQRDDVRNGWIYVDDLVQDMGAEVYAYLGRTDFLISTAGHKVAPSEVENVLSQHPGVKEVVVIGLPDPIRQEAVAAFVVVADGVDADDDLRRELQTLVKTQLSPYKYPRVVEFLDALPRDHVGKVQPKLVREHAMRSIST